MLLVGGEGEPRVGTPLVAGAQGRRARSSPRAAAAKITIFKKKRRKNYRRKQGHRQDYTEIRVDAIEG